MDHCQGASFEDKNEHFTINGAEARFRMVEREEAIYQDVDPVSRETVHMETHQGFDVKQKDDDGNEDVDVNMEAAITADDVARAGGFGATDDIGSVLPAAIDSTDVEASLRDARDFEETQEEKSRPGLGWTKPNDEKC